MLLGNYIDEKLAAEVYSIIDNIIELVICILSLNNCNLCSNNLFIHIIIIFSEKKIWI